MADYPDFIESTGYGTVEGLCGANCYHNFDPFVPGIDIPSYTEEELAELNAAENKKTEFGGKEYTKYEATQRQRAMERTMRAQRDKIELLEEGGALEDDILAAKMKYQTTAQEYRRFSDTMGLRTQMERVTTGSGKVVKKAASPDKKLSGALTNSNQSGKINIKSKSDSGYPHYPVDKEKIQGEEFREQFDGLFGGKKKLFSRTGKVDESAYKHALKALEENDGTAGETIFLLDAVNGKKIGEARKKHYWEDDNVGEKLLAAKKPFVLVHNHPNNTPLSLEDILAFNDVENMDSILSVGHAGNLCKIGLGKGKRYADGMERAWVEKTFKRNINRYGHTNKSVEMFCSEVGWEYGKA